MIRLGSLAGYPFEGPRVLGGWAPAAVPAVYAVLYRPVPTQEQYAVIYVAHSADLTTEGFPFRHPRAAAWTKRAGDKWKLYIAWYPLPAGPGATAAHREQIVNELVATYHPGLNEQQFDNAWEQEWIQDYQAPTQDPLTTKRDA